MGTPNERDAAKVDAMSPERGERESMLGRSSPGATIDPAARVDPAARIGSDVYVGPWCWIGPNVTLGDGCRLDAMVRLDGWTEIGARNHFHQGAVIGSPPQDLKYRGAPSKVVIGDENVFREYSTVNRATEEGEVTRIGNRCLIMAYAHVAHNCEVGDHAILANSANLAGHVEVGEYAIIGGVTPVHQFVKIGCHSMIGGGCRVPVDVAPYTKAAGNPLRVFGLNTVGLERRGFSREAQDALKQLYRIFFRSTLLKEQAIARIREELPDLPEVRTFIDFVNRSERGLAR